MQITLNNAEQIEAFADALALNMTPSGDLKVPLDRLAREAKLNGRTLYHCSECGYTGFKTGYHSTNYTRAGRVEVIECIHACTYENGNKVDLCEYDAKDDDCYNASVNEYDAAMAAFRSFLAAS